MDYSGSCHCGDIQFKLLSVPSIDAGLRCNCSYCKKKGIVMTPFVIEPEQISYEDAPQLNLYQFGEKIAKHYFCSNCGVHVFHQMRSKPGKYRANLACIGAIDIFTLPIDVFDGANRL